MRGGIILKNERKRLYIYACINYTIGILIGIILFYGQIKNNPAIFSQGYVYDRTVGIVDLVRAWWMNIMWLMASFIVHSLLPVAPFHIVIAIRGTASAFSVMYILSFLGIKEAVVSVIPQCLSILPILMRFSVSTVEKRREMQQMGYDGLSLKRGDSISIFLWALIGAVAEVILFGVLALQI